VAVHGRRRRLAEVEAFRSRPLDAGPYTFMAGDAVALEVSESGGTVNVHTLLAVAVNAEGYAEIPSLHVIGAEDGSGWLACLGDLTVRGLTPGVKLVTSDAHHGLVEAIGATPPTRAGSFTEPNTRRTSCRRRRRRVRHASRRCCTAFYHQPEAEAVHAQFDRIVDARPDKLPDVAAHLDAACRHPRHRVPRSDLARDLVENSKERLTREICRRTGVVASGWQCNR
jgi:putative transposase